MFMSNMLKSKNNLELPILLIHTIGFENLIYLTAVCECYKENTTWFKVPVSFIEKKYNFSKHKQKLARNYLIEHGIIEQKEGDIQSEGYSYKLDKQKIFDINWICQSDMSVDKFVSKTKRCVKDKLNLEKITEIIDKG